MSDSTSGMLIESLRRLLETEIASGEGGALEPGNWHSALWGRMAGLGMTSVASDYEEEGLALAAGVLVEIGRAAAVVPLLEHDVLAGWILAQAGVERPSEEVLSVAAGVGVGELGIRRIGGKWRLEGRIPRVPFGRHAAEIVLVASVDRSNWAIRVPVAEVRLVEERNLADEPRDHVYLDGVSIEPARVALLPPTVTPDRVFARGALGRSFQMLGAMERAFAMTHEYARTRVQFGRSLSQFQVIQGYLAEIIGEIAATRAMCEVALEAAREGAALEEIAAAKIRAGQAARVVADRSHQIHGAIGFTREYELQLATRRLWSWREEFGNESYWADRLGRAMSALGPEGLWERMTG